jgi:hypothetical protein
MDESAENGAGVRQSHEPETASTPATESSAASAENESGKPQATERANGAQLPIVWAPKPDAGARRPFSLHPALLAASIACAAAAGAIAGAASAPHLAHIWSAGAASSNALAATGSKADMIELSALKANIDGAARSANAALAKLGERLDHIEHGQSEPAAKIAHIAEAIDRLEKKNAAASAAPETTGSITSAALVAAAAAPAAAEAKPPERVVHDWIVQDVRGGRALVQSRYGGVFVVAAGSILPGLGRVEAVKRQGDQWVVVTARGLITDR